jgi:flagellar basal-body rod protein FlgB
MEFFPPRAFTESSALPITLKASEGCEELRGVAETSGKLGRTAQMSFTDIGLFALADQRLAWLDARQNLLAQNVANAATPGWKERDLQPFAATLAASAHAVRPVRTHPLHLVGTLGEPLTPDQHAKPPERAPDGNAVSPEDELVKIAETEDAHMLVVNLYRTYLGLFSSALT